MHAASTRLVTCNSASQSVTQETVNLCSGFTRYSCAKMDSDLLICVSLGYHLNMVLCHVSYSIIFYNIFSSDSLSCSFETISIITKKNPYKPKNPKTSIHCFFFFFQKEGCFSGKKKITCCACSLLVVVCYILVTEDSLKTDKQNPNKN